jgi:hypothetical protein
VERAVVAEPITVEVDRSRAVRPRLTGYWRRGEFYRVHQVLAVRPEVGETYYRVLTDRGAAELRRYRRVDPRTLWSAVAWEVCADLDVVELPRLR